MSQKLLTIAIPTYNGASTISCVLDSIVAQIDNRIEVMVINNCSTDNTLDIVHTYKEKIPNLRIISQDRNVGPDANFLDCFKKAEGRYIHLISDDDIYIDGAISKILDILDQQEEIGLAYLQTVGFYGKYTGKDSCDQKEWNDHIESFISTDKKLFMDYAHHYWGFVSSFICSSRNFSKMKNPERYFSTYWLQSYIHAYCAKGFDTRLAVISGPCIGAGRYININNFDSSLVDGVYYHKMIEFAWGKCGFDKQQMLYFWKSRLFMLARHNFIKEKAIGIKKQSFRNLFRLIWKCPSAWFTLFPFALVPTFVCKSYYKYYRKKRNIISEGTINRQE